MNKIRFSQLLFVGLTFVLTACQSEGQRDEMFQPGEIVGGMSLTTGAQDAPPLWAFCSSAQYIGNTTTSHCSVPVVPRLAVGHILMPDDDSLARLDWSAINWELSIDNQPIDLKSFGTYDFVLPTMSHSPSPVREVFVKFTAWDIVLTNLNPGDHKIHGLAQMGTESYTWVIYLTIEESDVGTGTPWVGPEIQEIS